jgi:hypothetical protein
MACALPYQEVGFGRGGPAGDLAAFALADGALSVTVAAGMDRTARTVVVRAVRWGCGLQATVGAGGIGGAGVAAGAVPSRGIRIHSSG